MGRAWDNPLTTASVGLQMPESAADWSKLAAAAGWNLRVRLKRPRTAQQVPMTIEKVNGKMFQTFRHLLKCSRRLAAELNRRAPISSTTGRTEQRLRIPKIATALAKSATKRSRWLSCGPRDPSPSLEDETPLPPNPE